MVKEIAVLLVCVAGGVAGGYIGASFSTVPAQIAIVDVQALVRQSVAEGGQSEAEAKALTGRIKRRTEALVEHGVVVIDAQMVVDAPKEAYVTVD